MVRSWRRADARSSGDAYRIRSARKMLQVPDPVRARLVGFMEWMPYEVQSALLANLATRGFHIHST
ncbi:Putative replication protein XF_b0001 (fragment) [Xanthomonas citri pv. citri]